MIEPEEEYFRQKKQQKQGLRGRNKSVINEGCDL